MAPRPASKKNMSVADSGIAEDPDDQQALPAQPPAKRPKTHDASLPTSEPSGTATMEPMSSARHIIQFTASAELRDKLDRLARLMPGKDLASVVEAAVSEKLEQLEGRPDENAMSVTMSSPSWSDMGPELIAKLSIFADIGDELMNLCVVAGPVTSRIIRKTFLLDNADYLRYCLALPDTKKLVRKQRILWWMESNPNWKELCRASHSGRLSELDRYVIHRVELSPNEAKNIRFTTALGGQVGFKGWNGDVPTELMNSRIFRRGNTLRHVEVERENDTITTEVSGMTLESLQNMHRVLGDSAHVEVRLSIAVHPFDTIFSNIGIVTETGLDQVLRVYAEDKGFDLANYIVPEGLGDQDAPLLWASLFEPPDTAVTEYLLSLGPVNMNCRLSISPEHPSVNILSSAASHPHVRLDTFAVLARNVDVNAADDGGDTVLHHVIPAILLANVEEEHQAIIAKARILLEAGADPRQPNNVGRTPIDYVRHHMRLEIGGGDEQSTRKSLREFLALCEGRAGLDERVPDS